METQIVVAPDRRFTGATELLERMVTEDDVLDFGGECFIHDGCRPV
ncbi:MAG: hypothetical protein J0J03_13830 [Leifsonia sp.]|nr:hypothetical protein [Leifsonia sp.]